MLKIKVNNSGEIEKSLKLFKNKFKATGVLNELRDRRQYTKKSIQKRLQKQKAVYNRIKKETEDE